MAEILWHYDWDDETWAALQSGAGPQPADSRRNGQSSSSEVLPPHAHALAWAQARARGEKRLRDEAGADLFDGDEHDAKAPCLREPDSS